MERFISQVRMSIRLYVLFPLSHVYRTVVILEYIPLQSCGLKLDISVLEQASGLSSYVRLGSTSVLPSLLTWQMPSNFHIP
jgi:hypothetical protein